MLARDYGFRNAFYYLWPSNEYTDQYITDSKNHLAEIHLFEINFHERVFHVNVHFKCLHGTVHPRRIELNDATDKSHRMKSSEK